MKKPLRKQPNNNPTVSLTDYEWGAIEKWAAERGMSKAKWVRECALTVDPLPKQSLPDL